MMDADGSANGELSDFDHLECIASGGCQGNLQSDLG